jgi:hypothetical protein
LRASTTTSSPRAISAYAKCRPMKPVAPLISTRFGLGFARVAARAAAKTRAESA